LRKLGIVHSLFLLPGGEGQDEGELKHSSIFPRASYNPTMADIKLARQLRKRETWAEKLVWSWLRDRQFNGYKFRRQHSVGNYSLDFFCEEAELAIELDGSGHGFPQQQCHDAERENFLKSRGIKTLRFWNSQLRRDRQIIRDAIFRELQGRAPHPLPDYTHPKINREKS
jgi:very-short-patch-repair endonuclease